MATKQRVAIMQDFPMGGIAVTFAIDPGVDQELGIFHFDENGFSKVKWVNRMEQHPPTLRLDEGFARALYEELQRHFRDAPTDAYTEREWRITESKRVDQLLTVVSKLALGEE